MKIISHCNAFSISFSVFLLIEEFAPLVIQPAVQALLQGNRMFIYELDEFKSSDYP